MPNIKNKFTVEIITILSKSFNDIIKKKDTTLQKEILNELPSSLDSLDSIELPIFSLDKLQNSPFLNRQKYNCNITDITIEDYNEIIINTKEYKFFKKYYNDFIQTKTKLDFLFGSNVSFNHMACKNSNLYKHVIASIVSD